MKKLFLLIALFVVAIMPVEAKKEKGISTKKMAISRLAEVIDYHFHTTLAIWVRNAHQKVV